jgi:hypothetical protein
MKKVISYLMLVAFSVLGIWVVVRLGESLPHAMCIRGPWKVEVSKQSTSSACHERFRQENPLDFSISQSGPKFSMSFNDDAKAALHGEIQNFDVSATAAYLPGISTRTSEDVVRLRATLDRQAKPARLWGVLSFSECPDLNFVATSEIASDLKAK